LLPPEIMAAPMIWLASEASNTVTGRRIVAAKWNPTLWTDQAAQAASSPVAWTGFGDRSIRPVTGEQQASR
jgi:3-oxoacyl-[acyl-carrier protein] reductase